jgi:hypothetical protein
MTNWPSRMTLWTEETDIDAPLLGANRLRHQLSAYATPQEITAAFARLFARDLVK